MQLDLQQVVARLGEQIGNLNVDLAAARVVIDLQQARIEELEKASGEPST